jgi:hypothetical protein
LWQPKEQNPKRDDRRADSEKLYYFFNSF